MLTVAAAATTICVAGASASVFEAGVIGKALSATTLAQHVFTLTGKTAECGSTKFEGTTQANSSETLTVHPVYSECKAFGLTATIGTKGCDYKFNANTTSGTGSLSIVDHEGETCSGIVITADPAFTTCTAVIPKQTIAKAIGYTNNSNKVKVKIKGSGIEASVTASFGSCPLAKGTHTGEKGATFTGESEISAAETTLTWWEQNPTPPVFDALVSPPGNWAAGETKKIKITDTSALKDNWTLRAAILQPTLANWEEIGGGLAGCQGKAIVGGSGFSCEFEVKCKTAGASTTLAVYWTNTAGRLGESYFALNCP